MAHFRTQLDTSRLPVLLLTWEGAPTDVAGLDEVLSELEEVWRRAATLGRPLSIVVDAANAGPLSAPLRQRQSDWLASHRRLLQSVVISVHVCISNPLVRGALTAIRWISSDLEMLHAHPRLDGALAAALADLEEAGHSVPDGPRPASTAPR